MNSRIHVVVALIALTAVAGPALASFNASDLIYVPVVAHNEGVNDSLWRSDIHITNVDTTPIDVAMVFFPSGLTNNGYRLLTRDTWLGGRAEEGFGELNEELADIPVGGTVVIEDLLGTYFTDQVGILGTGALLVFVYEAGTLEAEGGRTYRNAVVNSRTFNQTTIWVEDIENEGEFIEEEATYGQTIPGVAWYNLADGGQETANGDFSYMLLNLGIYDADYRYNLGIFNASDRLTYLNMSIKPLDKNGEPFIAEDESEMVFPLSVPPLAHIQYTSIVSGLFGFEEPEVAAFEVAITSWSTSNENPLPLFTTYGSLIDNRTSDATTILPVFEAAYNVDCMWAPADDSEDPKRGEYAGRGRERPVDIPAAH